MDVRLSELWLRRKVNPAVSSEELADQLTQLGLTVDRVEPAAAPFREVVAARILTAEPHEEGYFLCTLDDGNGHHTVVCGAPNTRADIMVAFAPSGAFLPEQGRVSARKIRQVMSAGVICSEAELGLSSNHEGILLLPENLPVGTDIWDWMQLDDRILHLDLASNRPDYLSVEGIAREVASINDLTANLVTVEPVVPGIEDVYPILLKDPACCPKYLGRIIRGIDITAQTPYWMKEALRRSNIRPLHPVVDVTNYVLRELGQPLHAFDLSSLRGAVEVRKALHGEQLTLLNDQLVELREDSLVIADESGPIALAGIMGGRKTAIRTEGSSTFDIFLECAWFSPLALAGQARSYGLSTDAAQCYERGVDYELQARAMERATRLLLDITGGEAGPISEVLVEDYLPTRLAIPLRLSRLNRVLALNFEPSEVCDILQKLNFRVQPCAGEPDYSVTPSGYRFDVHAEIDLIEEVARFHGYDRIPYQLPVFRGDLQASSAFDKPANSLTALGYHEAITYAFISMDEHQRVSPQSRPVRLKNPSTPDRSVMRASLMPGLLSALKYNTNRQQRRVRLFESGCVFEYDQDGALLQGQNIAGLIAGGRLPESWYVADEPVDFYDLKGDLEQFAALSGQSFEWSPGTHPALHPKQTARVFKDGTDIGVAGRLHPRIEDELGIREPVYLFEICWADHSASELLQARPVSAFPSIRRDLAVLVDRQVAVGRLTEEIRQQAGSLLVETNLFDLYEGPGVDADRKSVAISLIFQAVERSLLEAEVETIMKRLLDFLQRNYHAQIRA